MEKRIFLAWCICLILFRWHSINAQEYWKTLDYLVGPQAMPQGVIESYETNPFALPQLNYPSFPNYVVNIKNEGAEEGKPITALVNRLIKMVNERGGGKVVIPEGYWKSGRIELKSNVNLCVEEHAVIEFSGIPTDYLPSVYTMHEGVRIMGAGAFIYAYGAENIAITGRGKLIGPSMDFPTRQNRGFNSLASVSESFPADYRQRVFDGMEGRRFFSPKVISPVCCKNVLIEGIIIERSLFWNVNPILCENVIVRGVTVNSVGIASGDGIDLSCCKNVLVEYCTMNCGDDCYALKGARNEEGLILRRPTENVLIRYCIANEGHGGITIGSETSGGIHKVYVHSCLFKDTQIGIRFKTRRLRSGLVENLLYEDIHMNNVHHAIVWDMLGSPYFMGDLANRLPMCPVTLLTPKFQNIQIRNIKANSVQTFLMANGIPESPFRNVVIENGEVECKNLIPVMNDFANIVLRNLVIHSKDNRINILGGKNLMIKDCIFHVPKDTLYISYEETKPDDFHFENVKNVIVVKRNME